MLAPATTHDGEIPLFLHLLDSTSSETESVVAAVHAIQKRVRTSDEASHVPVADNGVSSDAAMRTVNEATIPSISRVSETSTQAKAERAAESETQQQTGDGSMHCDGRMMKRPHGHESRLIVRTTASEQRAQDTLQRHVKRTQAEWEKTCWHMGTRRVAWETDALAALAHGHTRLVRPPRTGERPALSRRARAASQGHRPTHGAMAPRCQREHHPGKG
jgi:transposase